VYKKVFLQNGEIFRNDSIFSVKTLAFNGDSITTGTASGLDTSKLYYLIFTAPSSFSGYIK